MEKRKIVKSGLFSYTIVLPKDWIERHNLEKGSKVSILEQPEGLLITPEIKKIKQTTQKNEVVISIDNILPHSVVRNIIAAYLTNIRVVRIHGKEIKKNIGLYKKTISKLPGLEVIEETSDYIIFKDYINIEEIIIPDVLRRSDIILRSMFTDTLECLDSGDLELSETIRLRDQEVNRLSFLTYKCLNHINDNPHEDKIHGIKQSLSPHIWEFNTYLEKIGDEIKRFAITIPKAKLSSKDKNTIKLILIDIEDFYKEIITSLYKSDISRADKNSLLKRDNIINRCYNYLQKSDSRLGRNMANRMIYMTTFINSISRIVRFISFEDHKIVKGNILIGNN